MTLREINAVLREDELTAAESPHVRIVALLSILRSLNQGETATDAGVRASVEMFIEHFGPVTTESVDLFMKLPDAVLDMVIPDDVVLDMIRPDQEDAAMNPAEMDDKELDAFQPESDHESEEAAANRVAFLNGGKSEPVARESVIEKTRGERWTEGKGHSLDENTVAALIDRACAEAVREERRTNADAVFSLGAAHATDNFRRDLAANIYVQLLTEFDTQDALAKAFEEADAFIAELAKTKGAGT